MSKRLSFISSTVLIFNILSAGLLLLAYFTPSVSPQTFWPIAFFGLIFPYLVVVNILFIAYWALKRHLLILLSLITLIIGWNQISNFLAFNFFPAKEEGKAVRIMTYNVKNFDLYNWEDNIAPRNDIIRLISDAEPDIICFQEFFASDSGDFNNIQLLHEALDMPYLYFEQTMSMRGKDHWGLAIMSKFPIQNKGKIPFENSRNNACIFADIEVEGKPLRVFNVHLQSIHFGSEDLEYIETLVEEQKPDVRSSRLLVRKLKRGFQKRAPQAEEVAAQLALSPHPTIVCGDFNDTPISYTYRTIAHELDDAFIVKGSGIGHTYAGRLPALRIDYLLFDKEFDIMDYQRYKEKISDHYPILASFRWE